jgi:hypothetical protein
MSEEKTRIVPRAASKGGVATITFQCGNGHRINVPLKLAGKRGTCSKCGVAVVIPMASSPAEQAPPPAEQAAPEKTIVEPVAAATEAVEPAPATDAFAGLFDGNTVAEPTVAEEILVDVTGSATEAASGDGSVVGDVVAGYGPEEFAAPDEDAAAENPTAQLVARLWLERAHDGVVEIHLAGGAVPILPEWYEPRWSRGTHGLFASQAADGTVTLTAVAWDSVQKIIVRGVKGLPDGMFE